MNWWRVVKDPMERVGGGGGGLKGVEALKGPPILLLSFATKAINAFAKYKIKWHYETWISLQYCIVKRERDDCGKRRGIFFYANHFLCIFMKILTIFFIHHNIYLFLKCNNVYFYSCSKFIYLLLTVLLIYLGLNRFQPATEIL